MHQINDLFRYYYRAEYCIGQRELVLSHYRRQASTTRATFKATDWCSVRPRYELKQYNGMWLDHDVIVWLRAPMMAPLVYLNGSKMLTGVRQNFQLNQVFRAFEAFHNAPCKLRLSIRIKYMTGCYDIYNIVKRDVMHVTSWIRPPKVVPLSKSSHA